MLINSRPQQRTLDGKQPQPRDEDGAKGTSQLQKYFSLIDKYLLYPPLIGRCPSMMILQPSTRNEGRLFVEVCVHICEK